LIAVKLAQPEKAPTPIEEMSCEIFTDVNALHPPKALVSIDVTFDGITIDERLLQPRNTMRASLVSPDGMLNDSNEEQKEKA